MNKRVLVTGVAGFVGSFLAQKLLAQNYEVIGVDNLNSYYDINLKKSRLHPIIDNINFKFFKIDISNKEELISIFEQFEPEIVINLAAQAGVRYSIENPDVYIESNINGFFNILEACRKFPVQHLLYASSSSVYGANQKVPFEESDRVEQPVSLYAATKKSNELMAYTYSHLYNIPASGLRFFTVYGPKGRPDMAYFKFVNMFFNNEAIHIYNDGDFTNDLYRDFTYIDDIVNGILKLMSYPPTIDEISAPHSIYNIGNNSPVKLMDFILALEDALGKSLGKEIEFKKVFEPIKPGDVSATYASTEKLFNKIGYKPDTNINKGLQKFTDWYVKYYNVK